MAPGTGTTYVVRSWQTRACPTGAAYYRDNHGRVWYCDGSMGRPSSRPLTGETWGALNDDWTITEQRHAPK